MPPAPAQPNARGAHGRSLAALGVLGIGPGACFSDAPTITSESASASSGDAITDATTSAATNSTSSGAASSSDTTDAATSGGTDSTSTVADGTTGSTLDPCTATLECPSGFFVCGSFEPPFAFDDVPWHGPTMVPFAAPPVLDSVAQCGEGSSRARSPRPIRC